MTYEYRLAEIRNVKCSSTQGKYEIVCVYYGRDNKLCSYNREESVYGQTVNDIRDKVEKFKLALEKPIALILTYDNIGNVHCTFLE